MSATARFASQKRVALKGSARKPFDSAQVRDFRSYAADQEPITVSVVLAPKAPIDPSVRLTREQFAERHCADERSEEIVRAFANEFGLSVDASKERARRTLHLTGSYEAMQRAFGIALNRQATEVGTFRLREGEIPLPEELAPHVVAVLGLDNRPQAKPHFRVATPRAGNVSYTPVQVAQFYGFPANASAKGQTIGLLELGGGFQETDISAYFQTLGLPAPTVTAVSVNVPAAPTSTGGRGVPDVAGDADPTTGYTVRVDGQTQTIGGTSAVAPLWAGLIALANAANGRDAGFVNATLYGDPSAFRDITSGNNGAFNAGSGWDPCTGLGSPHGAAVISALAT